MEQRGDTRGSIILKSLIKKVGKVFIVCAVK